MRELINRFTGEDGRRRLVEALRQQTLIEDDERLAAEVAGVATLREVTEGTVLIEHDAYDDDLFLILVGELNVVLASGVIARRGPREHVGEMALIDPTAKRSAAIVAATDALVARIAEPDFAAIAARHPEVWRRIALELGSRVRQGNTRRATADDEGNRFRRAGEFWTIAYDGESFSLRDSKGLHYLARLLQAPGQEIHSLELAVGDVASADEGIAVDVGDAGEILDGPARARYRQRVKDLREELDAARAANDAGQSERIEGEIEILTRELAGAFGLGGRSRKQSAAAERARKAVRARVSQSIARIDEEHPVLATHLRNAVHLGTFCSYRPERPTRWSL